MSAAEAPRPSRPPIARSPLIGRTRELGELDAALARCISDRVVQVVTLIGAAGIGKGRVVEEFLRATAERERTVRAFRGLVHQGGPMLGPVQRILRARFGITEQTEPEKAKEMLREAVSTLLDDRRVTEFLHFLGAYLEITFPESPFTKALEGDEEQLSRISRAVLRRFLEADAQAGPIILSFEGAEHAHEETLDLIRYLEESITAAPVLLVVSARPELITRMPGWGEGPAHRRIEMTPLSPEDAGALVRALLEPTGTPPEELVDAAVDIAGGSPYLLEQMVRTFLDSKTLVPKDDGSWEVNLDRLDDAQLPLSVEDAINARISSMNPTERALLERAAVMGSVFWLGALVSLGRLDLEPPNLWGGADDLAGHYRDLLDQLEEHDYVMRFEDSSIPGEEEFAFKHNLERDALHNLINPKDGKRYHRRVAEWLELRLAERGEEAFELLAQHYELGDAPAHAASYYLAAGDRARLRYANAKAADFYGKGLTLLGDRNIVRSLEAQHNYGDVLQLLGRNEEALEAFKVMLRLAYRLDVKSKGGAAHNRLGRLYRATGQLEEAMRNLGTGHALFDAAGDTRGVASSLDDVGKVHWMRGAYEAADRFMNRSLELRREIGDRRSIALSLNNLGLVYQDSGRFEEALTAFGEALNIRRDIGDAPGMAQTLNNLGTIHQDNGNHARASELWNEALEYARRVGDRMREAVILTNLGESSYRQNRAEEGIAILVQAEKISATLGDRILEAEILRGLAEAHLLLEDHAAAKDYVSRSVKLFEETRSKPFLGVALRTLADVHAASGEEEAWRHAEVAYGQSQRLFDELGNEIELARTCESYAAFLDKTWKGSDPQRDKLARELRDRALEIHGKQLASETYSLPTFDVDLPTFDDKTDPGTLLPDG